MRRIFIQNPLSANSQLPTSVASERGQSSVYFIICIMVVLLAVSLVGGFGTLMSGDTPFPVADTPATSGTPNPTSSSSGTTPSPTTNSDWKINASIGNCEVAKKSIKFKTATISVMGTSNGTLEFSVDGEGTRIMEFTPPQRQYTIILSNDIGVNTKKWKLSLKSNEIEKATYDGSPTNCN